MRIIDGKTVLLFSPEWSLIEMAGFFADSGYSLKRHDSGAIEVVKKVEGKKLADVVPIRKAAKGDLVPFLLSGMFPFQLPEHDGPGAA